MRIVKDTEPTARKQHTCCSCGSPIRKGNIYVNQVIADGAYLITAKSHKSCFDASQLIYGAGDMCEGELPPVDDFQEEDLLYIYDRQKELWLQLMKDSRIARQIWYGKDNK